MKGQIGIGLTLSLLLPVTSALAGGAARKGVDATFAPPSTLRFTDVPGAAGVSVAPADGDPAKGPSHFFLKFRSGFSAPLHHHTAEHHVVVVAGTLVLSVNGQDQRLPAGSYFAFRGREAHATRCDVGADCILFLDVRGKWDVVPESSTAKK